MRAEVDVTATVVIEVNDPDVIERVTGPEGDEWRAGAYNLHTEEEVLEHLAHNCAINGVTDIRRLDGWADCSENAATLTVNYRTIETEVRETVNG